MNVSLPEAADHGRDATNIMKGVVGRSSYESEITNDIDVNVKHRRRYCGCIDVSADANVQVWDEIAVKVSGTRHRITNYQRGTA